MIGRLVVQWMIFFQMRNSVLLDFLMLVFDAASLRCFLSGSIGDYLVLEA